MKPQIQHTWRKECFKMLALCGMACSGALLLLLCVAPLLRDISLVLNADALDSLASYVDRALEYGLEHMAMLLASIITEHDISQHSAMLAEYAERALFHYEQLSQATYDTLYMVLFSTLFATLFGLPLGLALSITKRGRICPHPTLNALLGSLANIVRSFPFIILIILLLPLSRALVGTSIGATSAIVPLSIAAIPFIARLFEGEFDSVDRGLIEATLSMGASKIRIMRMMIAEAKPGLFNAITITIIALIGYSAMGGAVGAGGLGDVAIRLGFQAYQGDVLCSTSVIIIMLVQCMQGIGDYLVAKERKMR